MATGQPPALEADPMLAPEVVSALLHEYLAAGDGHMDLDQYVAATEVSLARKGLQVQRRKLENMFHAADVDGCGIVHLPSMLELPTVKQYFEALATVSGALADAVQATADATTPNNVSTSGRALGAMAESVPSVPPLPLLRLDVVHAQAAADRQAEEVAVVSERSVPASERADGSDATAAAAPSRAVAATPPLPRRPPRVAGEVAPPSPRSVKEQLSFPLSPDKIAPPSPRPEQCSLPRPAVAPSSPRNVKEQLSFPSSPAAPPSPRSKEQLSLPRSTAAPPSPRGVKEQPSLLSSPSRAVHPPLPSPRPREQLKL